MNARLATLLVLCVIASFWIFRVILVGEGPPGYFDLLIYYYPHYLATFDWLARGELPLWNPYQVCGIPWLPALQIGAFYPPHVVFFLLPTGLAMASMVIFHALLSGYAMLALCRRLELDLLAGMLGACLITMSFGLSNPINPNLLETAAWIIPGVLAAVALARGGSTRFVALLGLSTGASLLAGYPQYTVYSVYSWALIFGIVLVIERPPLATWLRAGTGFAAGIVLGALVAAVVLIPTFELSLDGTRSLAPISKREMWVGTALTFELSFGSLITARPTPLGVSPLLLGALLIPFGFFERRNRALAVALLVLGSLAAMVPMGTHTPVYKLYLLLPTMSSFRHPSRILFVRDFCFSLLAAIGLHGVLHLLRKFVPGWPRLARVSSSLVLGLVVVGLFLAPPSNIDLPYFDDPRVQMYHEELDVYRVISESGDRVLLWNPGMVSGLWPKLATIFRMRSLDGYEPMSLRRQGEYFGYLYHGPSMEPPGRKFPFYGRSYLPRKAADADAFISRQRLVDLAAARYVLAFTAFGSKSALWKYSRDVGLVPVGRPERGLQLYRNPNALPRTFVTHHVKPAPPARELMALLSDPEFDPLQASYVEGELGIALNPEAPRGKAARILVDEATVVEVEAEMAAPGLLVLADSYYDRWHATVDGQPAPILPTNHLFRGVPVPAGKHIVRFEYRATSLIWSGIASLTGLVLLLLLWRRRSAATDKLLPE